MNIKKLNPVTQKILYLLGAIVLSAVLFFSIYIPRTFLYDMYSIPAGSMAPTINVGDTVIVNKHIYRDTIKGKPDSNQPRRGDIIAFNPPHQPNTVYLKRVIGIPGDVIRFTDKQLTINNKPVETKKLNDALFLETLNDTTYQVQYLNEENPYRDIKVTIPADHYFVMGDNRDNSLDSREWGFVPKENLIGKTTIIF